MKKKDKRKNHVSISEKEIKRKLYGESRKQMPKETAPEREITEKDIIKKLYSPEEKPVTAQEHKEKTADLFENNDQIQPGIQEEIDTLKEAISNLEEKLETSINQKERLKVKLVQKRKLINIRERLADLILNRMPEKFIMLLIVFLIFAIFMIMKSLMPATAPMKESPQMEINVEEATVPESKLTQPEAVEIQEKPQPKAITRKRYTIQAAEYADEEAAKRFINALRKQGYLVMVNTIYRDKEKKKAYFKINVGSYGTFNEAKKFNEIFKKRTNIKDSFIKELKR